MARPRRDLFLLSALLLFLELALIRWIPSHVLFLTFFTNIVLLACFLGLSAGLLAAGRERDYLRAVPLCLMITMAAAHAVERAREALEPVLDVGGQTAPQLAFWGTEARRADLADFAIPVELLAAVFFLLLASVFLGLGQALGRMLRAAPDRVSAYVVNVAGSLAGIALFALASRLELSPLWWFLPCAALLAYFLGRPRPIQTAALLGVVLLASLTASSWRRGGVELGRHFWSPYYRVDYAPPPQSHISVNLISHQRMQPLESPIAEYSLAHLLRERAGLGPPGDVLVIGAGSGNDVSRALQWGAASVDAVEIDPVIARLGASDHPARPYADPRVRLVLDDGRNFLRAPGKSYDLIIYALVDSLVLHSSYSNIRLESYLFTREAFADARRRLKPGGMLVLYNYYRQGWIVARLAKGLRDQFGRDPLVFSLPPRAEIGPERLEGFTFLLAGRTEPVEALLRAPPKELAGLLASRVQEPPLLESASDDWPFLYLRERMLPALSLRGMAIMAALSAVFLLATGGAAGLRGGFDRRMFFLGAGFMLVETKAVVQMALLFGSTWSVSAVVFASVLAMILAANLYVLRRRPAGEGPAFAGLFAALAVGSPGTELEFAL